MDAVDVALVQFEQTATLKHYHEYPFDDALRRQIRALNERSKLGDVVALDHALGMVFADAIKQLLAATGIEPQAVAAIGSHGQTIYHQPDSAHPTSVQIGDPNIISSMTQITTVTDFRRMDMANGGQGAPLASAFHQYQFQQQDKTIVVLNIGGMANITLLSKHNIIMGFDTGPGNVLLDDWIGQHQAVAYDQNGTWAGTGKSCDALLTALLSDPYFELAAPKSTGRDYFNLQWLRAYQAKIDVALAPQDVQATLLQLTISTITTAIKQLATTVDEVLVCGGGAYNGLLIAELEKNLKPIALTTTALYGLSPACIEAVTFAWLAKQRMDKQPINLSAITGANKPVLLGGVYSVQ